MQNPTYRFMAESKFGRAIITIIKHKKQIKNLYIKSLKMILRNAKFLTNHDLKRTHTRNFKANMYEFIHIKTMVTSKIMYNKLNIKKL